MSPWQLGRKVCVERHRIQPHGCDELPHDQEGIQDAGISTAENSSQHPQQRWQVKSINIHYSLNIKRGNDPGLPSSTTCPRTRPWRGPTRWRGAWGRPCWPTNCPPCPAWTARTSQGQISPTTVSVINDNGYLQWYRPLLNTHWYYRSYTHVYIHLPIRIHLPFFMKPVFCSHRLFLLF